MVKSIITHIIALLLALTVWIYSYELNTKTLEINIPLEIKLPAGFVLLGVGETEKNITTPSRLAQRNISVEIAGPTAVMEKQNIEKIRAIYEVKISELEANLTSLNLAIKLSADNILTNNPLIKVLKIYPTEVNIYYDKLVSKVVRVKANVEINVAKGFHIQDIRVNPSMVEILGPQRIVSNIDEISLDKVKFTEPISHTFTFTSRVTPEIEGVPVVCNEKINLEVVVVPELVTKTFKLPVYHLSMPNSNFKVSIIPEEVDITIKGTKEKIEHFNVEKVKVYIDLVNVENIKQGYISNLPVKVVLEDNDLMVDEASLTKKVIVKIE